MPSSRQRRHENVLHRKCLTQKECPAIRSRSHYYNQKKLKHPPAKHTPPSSTSSTPESNDHCWQWSVRLLRKIWSWRQLVRQDQIHPMGVLHTTKHVCFTELHTISIPVAARRWKRLLRMITSPATIPSLLCHSVISYAPYHSSAPNTECDIIQHIPQGQRRETVVNTIDQGTYVALSPPTACITKTAPEITPPDSLCTTTSHNPRTDDNLPTLDHHIFDKKLKTRVKKPPTLPQPGHFYPFWGLRMVSKRVTTRLSVLADTGCQRMLISYKLLRKIGHVWKTLNPSFHAYEHSDVWSDWHHWVCCYAFCWHRQQWQIVYVTNAANKLFLSKEACVDLGLISPSFPNIGDTQADSTSVQGLFARYEALRNKAEIPHVIGSHRVHTESFRWTYFKSRYPPPQHNPSIIFPEPSRYFKRAHNPVRRRK